MTQSELFAVMTEGFSTIAGSVLAAYINFGVSWSSKHKHESYNICLFKATFDDKYYNI